MSWPVMFKNLRHILLTNLLFLVVFAYGSLVFAQEKVDVIFYGNYSPYSYEKSGMPAGLFVDITKRILDSTSLNVTYRMYPFKRAMVLAKQGAGLVSGIYKTPERQRHFNYSNPYYSEKIILVSDKKISGSLIGTNFTSIKGWRVGLLRGMSYGEAVDNAINNKIIMENRVENDFHNYRKLKLGRIDGFFIDHISAQKLVFENKDETLVIHTESLVQGDVHFAAAKDMKYNQQILGQIDAALVKIKQNGSYQEILDNFVRE